MKAIVAFVVVLSACTGIGCKTGDSGPGNNTCQTDDDCRLFDDYCRACDCRALAKGQPDPKCMGQGVRCIVQPCAQKSAVCANQRCTVKSAPRD
jgi:hypothetical protein